MKARSSSSATMNNFIRAMAKTVLHISAGQLTPYAGDYHYYLGKPKAMSARAVLTAGEKL
jgi:ATP-binding cassette, subfamily F, member 3